MNFLNEELPHGYIIKKFYEFGSGRVVANHDKGEYCCPCPICREGKSFMRKRRCFYLPDKKLIYCFNCGWGSKPIKWISEISGMTYSEIYSESRDGGYDIMDLDSVDKLDIFSEDYISFDALPENSINLFDDTQMKFYKDDVIINDALAYIKKRRLDKAINRKCDFFVSLDDDVHKNRLIIPYNDKSGDAIFYQSRALSHSKLKDVRYLSKRNSMRSMYNVDSITPLSSNIYIFEGPIDSCFVTNGVAVGGINQSGKIFNTLQEEQLLPYRNFYNFIWILDSQWLDETSKKLTKVLLERGESVFVYPPNIGKKFKDFNDICVSCGINGIPEKFIMKNVLHGNRGVMKYCGIFL